MVFFNHVPDFKKKKHANSNPARQEPAILIICINFMVSLQLFPSAASRISSALMDDSFLKVFFNTFKERHQNFFWKKWTKYKYIYINLLNSSRHPTTPPLQIWGKKTQAPWKSIQTAMPRHRRPPWSHWYHLKAEYLPSDHRLFFSNRKGRQNLPVRSM